MGDDHMLTIGASKRPLEAALFESLHPLILDWSGTTIDYGSLAPVQVFRAVFEQLGINVSEAEAGRPAPWQIYRSVRSV